MFATTGEGEMIVAVAALLDPGARESAAGSGGAELEEAVKAESPLTDVVDTVRLVADDELAAWPIAKSFLSP